MLENGREWLRKLWFYTLGVNSRSSMMVLIKIMSCTSFTPRKHSLVRLSEALHVAPLTLKDVARLIP